MGVPEDLAVVHGRVAVQLPDDLERARLVPLILLFLAAPALFRDPAALLVGSGALTILQEPVVAQDAAPAARGADLLAR